MAKVEKKQILTEESMFKQLFYKKQIKESKEDGIFW